jgi:putative hydrolase of the HAD superfamily
MSVDIKAVTFDVGGTLIEPWPSVGHVYAEVAEHHGHQFPPEVLNQHFRAAWKAKQNFRHTRADWAALVRATFGTDACDAFFPELYKRFASPKVWRVFDDVRPALLRLKNEGIKLGIISNWDERLRPLLQSLELTPFFDAVVISVEVGYCKPSPEIFHEALRLLDLPPGQVLHVGDSKEDDVEGAQAVGIQAVIRKSLQFPFDSSD